MTSIRSTAAHLFVGLPILLILLVASPAIAQTRGRVTEDATTIWTANFLTVNTVVSAGTELEIVAQRGDWYEVVLPPTTTGSRSTGLVSVGRVELLEGPPPPKLPMPTATRPSAAQGAGVQPAVIAPQTGLRGFVHVGYGRFHASRSFEAILDRAGGAWYGAGIQYQFTSGPFIQGSVDLFRKTGERVFVFDGTVFRLGIEDKITAIPLLLTAGYRFNTGFGAPYAGGGIGRYLFKEESEFAEAAENVDEQFTSYHALGGMEWPIGQGLAAGAEVQYLWVPDALDGALATAFDEHDLGGIQFRVRLTVGR